MDTLDILRFKPTPKEGPMLGLIGCGVAMKRHLMFESSVFRFEDRMKPFLGEKWSRDLSLAIQRRPKHTFVLDLLCHFFVNTQSSAKM